MKKFIGILLGIVLMVASASMADALNYGSVTLSVSVSGDLSISISPTTHSFGALAPGTQSVSTAITVTNDSVGYLETYCFKGFNAGVWTLGATQGANTYTLAAAFHGSAPLAAAFGAEDLMKSSGWDDVNGDKATTTKFSIDGTQTGASVNPGQARSLYFRLGMPSSSTTMGPLDVTATITAILP
ncbi:MAG: hypothetical protein ABH868_05300 [bacterium]